MSYFHARCFEAWWRATGRDEEFAHLRRKWKSFTPAEREAFERAVKQFEEAELIYVDATRRIGGL